MSILEKKLNLLKTRAEVVKRTKYKVLNNQASHLVGTERKKIFYVCDYCGAEIEILKRTDLQNGGIVVIPHSVTKHGDIKMALCNKCLNPVLKEFEEMNNGKTNNL